VSVFAQLLAKRYQGQLQGDADQFIHFIVESAERMEKLIHDILDFSRLGARAADLFTRTSSEGAVDDAIRNLHSMIEESGAIVTREPLPAVMGDPVQLTRLFPNLLVNSSNTEAKSRPAYTWRPLLPAASGCFRRRTTEWESSPSMPKRLSESSSVFSHATRARAAEWAWPYAGRS